jgi:putative CocE/NonD family hydrolase
MVSQRSILIVLVTAVAVIVGTAAGWGPDATRREDNALREAAEVSAETVSIPMRDGVTLAGSLWRPGGPGPYPVVIQRTPYDRTVALSISTIEFFNLEGVAVLTVDVRGRYDSEGDWEPLVSEGRDGQDVIAWVDDQPWCNGMIGTMGGSYDGAVQLFAAALGTPELDAMAPLVTSPSSPFENLPFDGGPYVPNHILFAVTMRGNTSEPLPSVTIEGLLDIFASRPINRWDDALGRPNPWFDTWLSHWRLDQFWRERMFDPRLLAVQVPTLLVSGWFDGNRPGSIQSFQALSRHPSETVRQGLHFIIGPWGHNADYRPTIGELDFPANADKEPGAYRNQWLVDRLTGVETEDGPTIEYYLMGRNEWREAATWPPAGTAKRSYFLDAGGNLARQVPSAAAESYVYDPEDPTPIVDPIPLEAIARAFGHFPNNVVSLIDRGDTLFYETDRLAEPVVIAGPVTATLHFSSSAEDTDVGAHLVDITPDGRAISIAHGLSRLRFRHGYERTVPLAPGEIAEVEVDLWSAAYEFGVGHRIGVIISSAQFPAFDAHRNFFDDLATDTETQLATQTLHLGRGHPSRLVVSRVVVHEFAQPRRPTRRMRPES